MSGNGEMLSKRAEYSAFFFAIDGGNGVNVIHIVHDVFWVMNIFSKNRSILNSQVNCRNSRVNR